MNKNPDDTMPLSHNSISDRRLHPKYYALGYPFVIATERSVYCRMRFLQSELVELADDVFVHRAYCTNITLRAWILRRLGGKDAVAYGYTALWLYTGRITSRLQRSFEFVYPHMHKHCGAYQKLVPDSDIREIGSIRATSHERTAIDLLAHDLAQGTEHMCAIIRAGTSLSRIRHRAHQSSYVKGIQQIRRYLDALPEHIDASLRIIHDEDDALNAERRNAMRAAAALRLDPSMDANGLAFFRR